MQSKKEYINILKVQYHQARRKATKSEIINELVTNLAFDRKYAITILNQPKTTLKKVQKRKRQKRYTADLILPLTIIWDILNKPCSKRLRPMIPTMLKVLERFKEIQVTATQKELLIKMGTWTIDRMLRREKGSNRKGIGGTRPSKYMLNKKIKIRVNFDDVHDPGNLEMDTVHHCGEKLEGEYAVTLNNIDIQTLWSEQECFLRCLKSQVISGFDLVRKRFPYPITSADFDNGGEFKNYEFVNYCDRNKIDYTRSRSYKKNDQCYIEGNNFVDVRELTGYERYETKEEVDLINDLYRNEHRLLNNFFYPNMKLKVKKRDGAKVTKTYDTARTPYQRVLESNVPEETKKMLMKEYEKLNPAELKRNIRKKLTHLKQVSRVRKLDQATIAVR